MFKRALLAFAVVVAVSAVGSKAMAWSDCHHGVVAYPYAYPPYYVGYGGYNRFAIGPAYYPAYTVPSYPVYYGRSYDRHRHHNHRNNGVTVSFGF